MDKEVNLNSTDIVYEMHPCYEVINFSYVLARSPSIQCILIYILLCLFSVVAVCGNGLVIISVGYFKQLHTPTNFLVLSLAVADVLVGLIVFPLSFTFTLPLCVYEGNVFCNIKNCLDGILGGSSILHLCCISIDRYFAVCKPLTYTAKINNRVAAIMILVCWGTAVLIGIAVETANFNQGKCDGDCAFNALVGIVTALIVVFYIPVLVMIIIYLKIFLVARRQARSIQNAKSGATVSKTERKATKTLAIVMGVFLLCMGPYFVCVMVDLFSDEVIPLAFIETLSWLGLCNSMLNPFIYGFFYRWFRCAFKMIITGRILKGDLTCSKLF